MTREERRMAIEELKRDIELDNDFTEDYLNAVNMAIEALEQEPCEDCISRQAVIDILDDMTKDYAKSNDFEKVNGVAWVKVQKLPSVNPQEPKIGHWILTDDDVFVYCSECEDSYYKRPIDASWHYCPNCGCRMAESEDK